MPSFILAWNSSTGRFLGRAAVGPVSAHQAARLDRVIQPEERAAYLQALDEVCPPPFCVVVELDAPTLEEAEERVRGWHFT